MSCSRWIPNKKPASNTVSVMLPVVADRKGHSADSWFGSSPLGSNRLVNGRIRLRSSLRIIYVVDFRAALSNVFP
jgi:hypothetical protein